MINFKTISVGSDPYLKRLSLLAKPVETLYYYGTIPQRCNRGGGSRRFPFEQRRRPYTVAIIGARKCSEYGEKIAYELARELARLGIIVVSGMALGVDAAAHRGALAANGITLAVLGTPIDKIYPRENQGLFQEIIARGAVFSEYAPGFKAAELKINSFLYRNRIIAGLADAVVVVEASRRSGSLNTAHHALLAGVPVLAVPGDITRSKSEGCNLLFKDGARPCLSVQDVLEEIGVDC